MSYAFCTYFDRHYLPRALVLYHSLRRHCPAFHLWALCFDHESYTLLACMNLPALTPLALADLERADPELAAVRPTRSRIEYYFTCTPALPRYLLQRHPQIDAITYLDADLCFFADPAPLFAELGERSIAIIPHRFAPNLRERERHGIYNVGWVSFRRSPTGLAALAWWRARCLEWCYDRVEPGRFADQKYLDDWPERFMDVAVIQHRGANVAPWNLGATRLAHQAGRLTADGAPLIFFHYHDLKAVTPWMYDTNLHRYGLWLTPLLRRRLYAPYVARLVAFGGHTGRSDAQRYAPVRLVDMVKRQAGLASHLARGQVLVVSGRRVV